jgi:hypothetical protein
MTKTSWLRFAALGLVSATACAGDGSDLAMQPPIEEGALELATQALTGEDGLADAYTTFKRVFTQAGQDWRFNIGFGHHPGLSTEKRYTSAMPPRLIGETTSNLPSLVCRKRRTTPRFGDAGTRQTSR